MVVNGTQLKSLWIQARNQPEAQRVTTTALKTEAIQSTARNKRFDSSKKFSKGKRSDTRDGENRNEGRSYNKGKNFKRDDRDGGKSP